MNRGRVTAKTKDGDVFIGEETCIGEDTVEAFVVSLSDAIGRNNKTVYFRLLSGDWVVIPIENLSSITVEVDEECESEGRALVPTPEYVAYQEDYPECDCGQSADEWHAAGCPALRREQR